MNTDKVGVLTAEQARLCCDEQERVSLQRVLRHHCDAITSGAHVVIDTATHVAVEKMTEAEAREAFEAIALKRNPSTLLTRELAEPERYYMPTNQAAWGGYLAALRSLNLIKD